MVDDKFEAVYMKHRQRIYYYLHRLNIPPSLYDEFYAEGMYALWQAYKRYNPTKGKLTTYLNYQIKFKLIDLIRKKEGERQAEEILIKETATLLHTGNYNRQKNQMLISFEVLPVRDHSLWLKIRSLLTLKQWKWIYYFIICDMSLSEIARLENVTIEAVKGWAKEARKKLRHDDTLKTYLIDSIMM